MGVPGGESAIARQRELSRGGDTDVQPNAVAVVEVAEERGCFQEKAAVQIAQLDADLEVEADVCRQRRIDGGGQLQGPHGAARSQRNALAQVVVNVLAEGLVELNVELDGVGRRVILPL